jgi:hypothetical protein
MQIRFIFATIPFFVFSNKCISQYQKEGTIYVKNFPVKNGVIFYHNYNFGDPSSGINIITENDSVFHFENGIVVSIFSIEDEKSVLIKNKDNIFICYIGLEKNCVEKDDSVFKNTFIGKLKMNEDKKFDLQFSVINKNGNFYYQKELIAFLNISAWDNTLRIEN